MQIQAMDMFNSENNRKQGSLDFRAFWLGPPTTAHASAINFNHITCNMTCAPTAQVQNQAAEVLGSADPSRRLRGQEEIETPLNTKTRHSGRKQSAIRMS